jgi:hypothetical protein
MSGTETRIEADVVRTSFPEFLGEVHGGRLAFRASEGLEAVVKAVRETAKAGELVIRLKVEPLKGSVSQLAVSGRVVKRLPEETETSVFFPTEQGKLTRKNPTQPEFKEI